MVSYGEQEKESIIRVRVGLKNPSLGITVCHRSASLVMPITDPRDGFFYPTLTLMIDYTISLGFGINAGKETDTVQKHLTFSPSASYSVSNTTML